MASSTSFKAPPSLTRSNSYETWLKELQIWKSFTDIPGDKRGPAVFLSLEGKACGTENTTRGTRWLQQGKLTFFPKNSDCGGSL